MITSEYIPNDSSITSRDHCFLEGMTDDYEFQIIENVWRDEEGNEHSKIEWRRCNFDGGFWTAWETLAQDEKHLLAILPTFPEE